MSYVAHFDKFLTNREWQSLGNKVLEWTLCDVPVAIAYNDTNTRSGFTVNRSRSSTELADLRNEWIQENITEKVFTFNSNSYYFESRADAIIFRLWLEG